ncbi:hypothetical protein KJ641_01205 [Patescibacteria group bacterium]|nr:hypothetical protein [Patescibacteria group bacterium]
MDDREAKRMAAEIRSSNDELSTLDLHGLHLHPDEVTSRIDVFLCDSFKQNPNDPVEIVCGIGIGAMKKIVKDFLEIHPMVDDLIWKEGSCIVMLD